MLRSHSLTPQRSPSRLILGKAMVLTGIMQDAPHPHMSLLSGYHTLKLSERPRVRAGSSRVSIGREEPACLPDQLRRLQRHEGRNRTQGGCLLDRGVCASAPFSWPSAITERVGVPASERQCSRRGPGGRGWSPRLPRGAPLSACPPAAGLCPTRPGPLPLPTLHLTQKEAPVFSREAPDYP